MEKRLNKIIVMIIILILVAINVGIYLYYSNQLNQSNESKDNNNNYQTTEKNNTTLKQNSTVENIVESKISNMNEENRIRSYYGKFIDLIQSENYKEAYNYLNDEFKANYFQTIEEFSDYMSKKYPKNRIVVKYNTVERKGEIFVLSVNISDGKDKNFQTFSENVVIREISVNNFSISFSKDVRITDGRSE